MRKLVVAIVVLAAFSAGAAPAAEPGAEKALPFGKAGARIVLRPVRAEYLLELVSGADRRVIGSSETNGEIELKDLDGDGAVELIWREVWEDGPGALKIYRTPSFAEAYRAPAFNPYYEYRRVGKQTLIAYPAPGKLLDFLVRDAVGGDEVETPIGFVSATSDSVSLKPLSCEPGLAKAMLKEADHLTPLLKDRIEAGRPLKRGEGEIDERLIPAVLATLDQVRKSASEPCPG